MAFKAGVVGGALMMMVAGSAHAQAQGPAAQPSPVGQPAPTVQPAPPPPGYAQPPRPVYSQPGPPPGYSQPGPGGYAPQPPRGYAAQPSPYLAPPPNASPLGHGITLEANLGLGWLRASNDDGDSASEGGVGGLNLGIGGWISPRAALSLRIAGVTHSEGGGRITGAFFGGSLQYWTSENFWVGGGAGVGIVSVTVDDVPDEDPENGLGLDFRVGYTPLIGGQNSLNFSLEVNPTFLDGRALTGIALLIGYQYL